jgi:hypothetical protein
MDVVKDVLFVEHQNGILNTKELHFKNTKNLLHILTFTLLPSGTIPFNCSGWDGNSRYKTSESRINPVNQIK